MSTDFATPNYYEILMVPPSATSADIQAAYRRLARNWHPDLNKSTEAHTKMVEINTAKEVLLNPEARLQYDSWLSSKNSNEAAHRAQGSWQGSKYQERAEAKAKQDVEEMIVSAARSFWRGSDQHVNNGHSLKTLLLCGFSAWGIVLLFVFPPAAFMAYAFCRATFFPENTWVGIGAILQGMVLWIAIAAFLLSFAPGFQFFLAVPIFVAFVWLFRRARRT